MKKLLSLSLLLITVSGISQTKYQLYVDSLGIAISDYINAHKDGIDSLTFSNFMTQMANQITGSQDSITVQQKMDLPVFLLSRISHHNDYMEKFITQNIPSSKYWTHTTEMPPSSISQEDCASFWTHHKFIYHSSDTSTVLLTIDENYWIDSMSDHTYSKLTVEKSNDQTFNSTFIESNNRWKSLISIPGDVYCYQILKKTDHSYKLSTHMKGISSYFIFELEYQ